jgi:O-6-methylguanine DNA methyltransferase
MHRIAVQQIGDVWYGVALKGDRISACGFSLKGRGDLVRQIVHSLPRRATFEEVQAAGYASAVLAAMNAMFEGEPVERTYPLELDRLTPFTRKVLVLTAQVPRGCVATYGGIAKAAGNGRAARAVGAAEASNPFAPLVPCHRVVDSQLRLHGYGGGLAVKRGLLEREGVIFEGDRVARTCLWTPERS